MTHELDDPRLIDALEEFQDSQRAGHGVQPEAFRDRLGTSFDSFLALVGVEQTLDDAMDPALDDGIGETFGAYRILYELGRGAVGIVYAAEDERLGRRVALKVLKPGLETDARTRRRWEREAKHLAGVQHDHVAEVYEAGEHEGRLFYAMTLVDGVPLGECMRGTDVPDTATLCERIAAVADALQVLHDAGAVHRDVKPSNIIVQSDGKMLLADFGLARYVHGARVTKTGELLGTPLYMSPEQMAGRGAEIDGRTDVYALGVTLYEVLSGRRPFEADELHVLYKMILEDRPPSPREHAPSLPADLERIVMKCIEKRPDDRYATAAELARDLRAFAEGRTVAGRPVSPLRHRVREVLARPWVAATAALVLIALTILAVREIQRPDTATVTIASLPAGEVSVAGGDWQATPAALELAPGAHEVRVRSPGFREHVATIDVTAGGSQELVYPLAIADPNDAAALQRLLEAHDLPYVEVAQIDGDRSGTPRPVQLVYPRGPVRLEDCGGCRVDVSDTYDGSGWLVFRIGGAEIAAMPFASDDAEDSNILELPEAVRELLKTGVVVDWAYEEAGTAWASARFEVVAPDLGTELDRAAQISDAQIRAVAQAHLYVARNLQTAAFRVLEPLLSTEAASEPALRLAYEALRRMLPDGEAALARMRIGTELVRALERLRRSGR